MIPLTIQRELDDDVGLGSMPRYNLSLADFPCRYAVLNASII